MTQNGKEKIRLNLELSPKVNENLQSLKDRTDSPSLSEVLRKSVALFDLVTAHLEKGGSVILRNADGQEEAIRLL